jgi:hypothetical protein
MIRKYEVFEKFPDGSSLWRACVLGPEVTRHHLLKLIQKSEHQFYAIEMVTGKIVCANLEHDRLDFCEPQQAGRKSKSQAA